MRFAETTRKVDRVNIVILKHTNDGRRSVFEVLVGKDLSTSYRRHLKERKLDEIAIDLEEASLIFEEERRFFDELRALMLVFYIELSGASYTPFIDSLVLFRTENVALRLGFDSYQVGELYMEKVHPDATPRHIMTVRDSLYLLELCLSGRKKEADSLLEGMVTQR